MKDNEKNHISRKNFLKSLGGIAAASTAAIYGCNTKEQSGKNSGMIDGEMEYRVNHKTGDKVSLLGFGCMRLPVRGSSKENEVIDQETFNQLVDYAIAHGVNYFDTSPAYGKGLSERATGVALKRYPREKFFVATKLSNFRPDSIKKRKASIAIYHNSFKELQVDYIDYYLLHGVGLGGFKELKERYLDNGLIDFLLREREAGRIRNLGWSFHGDVAVFDHLLSTGIKWDFVQIQLNYLDWKHATGWNVNAEYLYNQLAKHNIQAVVMEPLLGGRLARLNYDASKILKQQNPDASIPSWAFRFAGSFPNVLTVLSGMTYKENLVDNLHTYSPLVPLTDKEKELLEEAAAWILKYPLISCTDCKYCMPCPYGLDIPGIFTHFNRCVSEGNFPKSIQDENYIKARRAFLISYDRKVPKERQADHCIGCRKCIPLCPQRLDIPKEMARVNTYVEHLKQGSAF